MRAMARFCSFLPPSPWSPTSTASIWISIRLWIAWSKVFSPSSTRSRSTAWRFCASTIPMCGLFYRRSKSALSPTACPRRPIFCARDLQTSAMEVQFSVMHRSIHLGRLRLRLPGRHSATNALAAVAVARELEIPFSKVVEALGSFTGIHRRFEIKGEPRGILVIDDYGHHPVEIQATVQAIRDGWKRPLTVIFQPHRYSRTRDLFDDFLTNHG